MTFSPTLSRLSARAGLRRFLPPQHLHPQRPRLHTGGASREPGRSFGDVGKSLSATDRGQKPFGTADYGQPGYASGGSGSGDSGYRKRTADGIGQPPKSCQKRVRIRVSERPSDRATSRVPNLNRPAVGRPSSSSSPRKTRHMLGSEKSGGRGFFYLGQNLQLAHDVLF